MDIMIIARNDKRDFHSSVQDKWSIRGVLISCYIFSYEGSKLENMLQNPHLLLNYVEGIEIQLRQFIQLKSIAKIQQKNCGWWNLLRAFTVTDNRDKEI